MDNQEQVSPSVTDALHAQRRRGFTRLLFEPHLERGFLLDYAEQGIHYRRILVCSALVAVIAVIAMDTMVFDLPPGLRSVTFPLQVFAILPTMLLALITAWITPLQRYSELALLLAISTLALATTVMRAQGVTVSYQVPMEYTATVISAVFFLGWIPFWRVLPVVVLLTLILVGNEWLFVQPGLDGWYRVSVNLMLISISIAGGYCFEYFVRQSWLSRRLLEQLSNQDPLTGLLNRRAFHEAANRGLRQAAREHKVIALALLDIDYFKAYNDNYGHQAGDRCLVRVAQVLQGLAKRPLDVCCRYGGEEFVVAWFDIEPETVQNLVDDALERIRGLEIDHAHSPVQPILTASLGLATVVPGPSASLTQLLEVADQAMYRAKQNGRNQRVVQHLRSENLRSAGAEPFHAVVR